MNMEKNKCAVCSEYFDDSETYEYRGFLSCAPHFDELQSKVDHKRQEVMETVRVSTLSQRNGEFVNNHNKYHLGNVAPDGLPIVKVREPQILKEYEAGIL